MEQQLKQKQIEEMARICREHRHPDGKCKYKESVECLKECEYYNPNIACRWIKTAEASYKAGYRKIPENAVVLTREDWERQQKDNEDFDKFARSISDIRMKNGNKIATFKDLQDYIELQVKQGSKEMAEKFAKETKQRLRDKLHRGKALHTTVFGKEYVRRIFKEVVDEICKEITEKGV